MAFAYGALVQESSVTTGTGTWTLSGAPTGMQTFSTGIGNGNTCLYKAVSQDGGYEEGLGTVSAGALARTTIYYSSNAGAAVNFTTPLTISNVANTGQLNGLLPYDYIGGLISAWTSVTSIGCTAGRAKNSTNYTDIILPSAFTKTTSAWAVGTGNGGLDTGAIGASTAYHFFVILKDSDRSADVLFSLSATAPTMPTGYTYFRRIFSIKTNGSSQFTKFFSYQVGASIVTKWDVPIRDVNTTNPGTGTLTHTLTVPTGIRVGVIGNYSAIDGSSSIYALIYSDGQTITAPSSSLYDFSATGGGASGSTFSLSMAGQFISNTSGQIQSKWSVSGAADVLSVFTMGWIDYRNAND